MSIPGSLSKNQEDSVRNQLSSQEDTKREVLNLPGIKDLHNRPKEEIATVLINVLKSRSGIVSFTYNVGESIEIVYESNPFSQLRG